MDRKASAETMGSAHLVFGWFDSHSSRQRGSCSFIRRVRRGRRAGRFGSGDFFYAAAWGALFCLERSAARQHLYKFTHGEVFCLHSLDHFHGQVFIRKAKLAPKRVGDEVLGQTPGEGFGPGGEKVAQLKVVFECRAPVECPRRIYSPVGGRKSKVRVSNS